MNDEISVVGANRVRRILEVLEYMADMQAGDWSGALPSSIRSGRMRAQQVVARRAAGMF